MSDLTFSEPQSHFDCLLDSILLLIFNRIGDVKALGRCCVVSRRFHSLVPQVDNVFVWVDCVISNDDFYLLLFPPWLSPLPRFWVVMFMGLISWIYWIWFGEEHEAWSSCPGEEEEQCSSEFFFSFFVFEFEFFQFYFLLIKMLTCH